MPISSRANGPMGQKKGACQSGNTSAVQTNKSKNSNNNIKETKREEKRSKTNTKTCHTILTHKKINSFVNAHKSTKSPAKIKTKKQHKKKKQDQQMDRRGMTQKTKTE
eukprot:4149637-Ditylum_brightwellii.AAC.1